MNLNTLLAETVQIVSAIVPVNLATAANDGDWVSLKNYERCTVVVFKGAGTAGDDPVITLKQATDVSGSGAKALNFTRVDKKVGTQTGIGSYTTATQAAGNTHTDDVSAEAEGLFLIEIDASNMDVNNGFDCLQVSIPDTGTNAQIGCALYILRGARYSAAGLPSAIAN